MTEPLNYNIDVATPFQSAMQGYAAGAGIRDDQQKQMLMQQQQQAAQQQQQMFSQLANNPSSKGADYARVMTAMPSVAEALSKAWATKNTEQQQSLLNDIGQWGYAIKSGRKEIAVEAMNAKADSMERAFGGQTPESQALRTQAQVVDAHPEFALGTMISLLETHPGGENVARVKAALGKEARDSAQAPADLRFKNAQASFEEARANGEPRRAQADVENVRSQIVDRAFRQGLDTDKLRSEYGFKVAELNRKPGAIDLPDSALKIVNEAAGNAIVARQSAAQLNDLASQFETADPNSLGGSAWELAKQATGQQDYTTALRNEYVRLRAGEVTKLLPPGPASDIDVKNAMAGFPTETASSSQIASFMRGLSKLQSYNAQVEDAKSEWAGAVGHTGKTARDIEIGGTSVPAGTTFSEFVKRTLKPMGANTQRPAPAADAKSRLLQTYGGVGSSRNSGLIVGTD